MATGRTMAMTAIEATASTDETNALLPISPTICARGMATAAPPARHTHTRCRLSEEQARRSSTVVQVVAMLVAQLPRTRSACTSRAPEAMLRACPMSPRTAADTLNATGRMACGRYRATNMRMMNAAMPAMQDMSRAIFICAMSKAAAVCGSAVPLKKRTEANVKVQATKQRRNAHL